LEQAGVGTIVGTISGRDRAVYRCFFLVSREINVRHVSVEIFIRSFFLSFNRYFPLVAILAVRIYRFLLLSWYAEKLAKSLSQMFVVLLMRIMAGEIKIVAKFREYVDQYRKILQPRLYIVESTIFATVSKAG